MATTPHDSHQLAGLDPRERGFSRPVELTQEENRQYRALLRYEATHVVTAPTDSRESALQLLIATLHGQGYRQLKTQISFRNGIYLGSRESWIEYPDPPPDSKRDGGLVAAIWSWFQREKLSA
jgi:hypothetical protein